MTNWIILIVLIPAVVIPTVMLLGFAGCSFEVGLVGPSPPVITSAVATSVSSITVEWTYGDVANSFEIERTKVVGGTMTNPNPTSITSPFVDTGLDPDTTYRYRVRALTTGTDPQDSDYSASVDVKTLNFKTSFQISFAAGAIEEPAWEGWCLVQRIEPAQLASGGTPVRMTLRGAASSGASIDRIFISQPDPAGDDRYDSSAADLTAVTSGPVPLPAATAITLPPVSYTLNATKPLLIAFDFSAAPPPSSIPFVQPHPDVTAYYLQKPEASIANRQHQPPYIERPTRMYLIEKIEVG